jgi:hypothetical protein
MAQAEFGILKPQRKRRWLWRLILLLLLLPALGFGLLRWVMGPQLQDIYSRQMQKQLAWYEPRYPTLKPLWMVVKWPMKSGDFGERTLLLAAGSEDRFDPTAEFATDLPTRTLAAYLTVAKEGDTIVLPAGVYTDCASIDVATLTLKAETPGSVQLDGGVCGGKATLVARGQRLTVDGLVFKNVRVADGNGAGIRLEQGELRVLNSIFYNSENAILTIAEGDLKIEIDKSLFVRLGRCDGELACAHSIYAGKINSVSVRNSVFRYGAGGHFIKSRAQLNEITDNILDGTRGNAGYLIDFPAGSAGEVRGNKFIKGKGSNNRCCIIRIAAEGKLWESSDLRIEDNDVVSKIPFTIFVWNDSEDPVYITNNRLDMGIKTVWGKSRSR